MVLTMNIKHSKEELAHITKTQIARLKWMLENLRTDKHLCSFIGEEIIAEFNYRGNKLIVEGQLELQIHVYEKHDIDADGVSLLMDNAKRLDRYFRDQLKEPYAVEVKKLVAINLDEAIIYSEAMKKRRINLHEKKECTCYCNGSIYE